MGFWAEIFFIVEKGQVRCWGCTGRDANHFWVNDLQPKDFSLYDNSSEYGIFYFSAGSNDCSFDPKVFIEIHHGNLEHVFSYKEFVEDYTKDEDDPDTVIWDKIVP